MKCRGSWMVPQNRKGIRPKTSMLEEDSQLQLIIKHSSWFFHSDMGVRLGERQAWGGCELPACGQLHCQTPEPGLRVGGWSARGLWAAFI